jgi:hypothetical protein
MTTSCAVGRIWFANDACDQRACRWIEGAIAAAIKNAYAIHAGCATSCRPGKELPERRSVQRGEQEPVAGP